MKNKVGCRLQPHIIFSIHCQFDPIDASLTLQDSKVLYPHAVNKPLRKCLRLLRQNTRLVLDYSRAHLLYRLETMYSTLVFSTYHTYQCSA